MPKPFRRRRTPQACVSCRRRKTKCDGARPRCWHCSSRDISCFWGDDGSRTPDAQAYHNPRPLSVAVEEEEHEQQPDAEAVATKLPESWIMHRCLDIFFERHSSATFCSFLCRRDVEAEIEGASTSGSFLMAAMLCLCARHLSPRQAKSYFGLASGLEASRLYVPMARRLARAASDQPSVRNIQANLILAVSEFLDNEGSSHWMYTGIATRMAQIMRLNMGFHQRHSLKEREIRRRTMWACVFVDSWICYFLGKPPISASIVRTYLPGTDASMAFQEPSRSLTLETIGNYAGYPSDIGLLPYIVTTVSLWSDLVNITVRNPRFLYTQPPTDPTSPLRIAQQALQKWSDNLPEGLQWSPEAYQRHTSIGQGRGLVMMHLLLRSAPCAANHAYLPQLDSTSILQDKVDNAGWSLLYSEPAIIAACVENALATAKMVSYLFHAGDGPRADLQTMHVAASLFSISNTLLWLQYAGYPQYADDELIREAGGYFELVLSILSSWQGEWKAVERWLYALRGMRALYRAAYLSELDEAMMVDATPSSSSSLSVSRIEREMAAATGEDRRYRPQPGDGYPPTESIRHLYDCLRLFVTDVSVDSQTLQDVWMQLAMGWSQNMISFDETPEYIGGEWADLRF